MTITEEQVAKIKKRFPADLNLEIEKDGKMVKTFLTNKKNSAGVYTLLLEASFGMTSGEYKGETVASKKAIGKAEDNAKKLKFSKDTYYRRLKDLKSCGYIKEITINDEDYYWLPRVEDWYFETTLKTISFFARTAQDHVIKSYIYLGRKYELPKQKSTFTLVELGEHTGLSKSKKTNKLNNKEDYATLWYDLYFLQKIGLIDIEQHFKNNMPYFTINKIEKNIDAAKPISRDWTKQTGEAVAEAVVKALEEETMI